MKQIHLAFGSNILEREKMILSAYEQIEKRVGRILKKSKTYETEPWGYKEQPDFLNSVTNRYNVSFTTRTIG